MGFYCKVCSIGFNDAMAFVNHNNSSAHQAKLGVAMVTKKSTKADVLAKLKSKASLKSSKHQAAARAQQHLMNQVKARRQRLQIAEEEQRRQREAAKQKRANQHDAVQSAKEVGFSLSDSKAKEKLESIKRFS
eukprot:CAMPEP_0117419144 /NCGR_PEP_ID=MMETSP0758-20121206/777_1 /TAXON_ID=63605 /ORGANISM="Percolomonas cosmopolitus, Strain AE-1 (ATCC 50343)" /LENGTH=132 /DNA_ID=CAMNT_0005200057 /DNA_START=231 /DNA_END=625 /DNA_ORIENTATION=+